MSQAIVDPIELRRFANNLKKFNQELEERMTSLRGQLQSLGATWRDQEHKKFTEDFEHHTQIIAKFIEHHQRTRSVPDAEGGADRGILAAAVTNSHDEPVASIVSSSSFSAF